MDGVRDIYFIVVRVVYLATDTYHYIISRTLDSLGGGLSEVATAQ
jgi:hypothetical protein